VVTLIDPHALTVIEELKLVHGSHSLRDIVSSVDGNYLYVSHILSRNQFPTTQLEHGWMNTNAISILDVRARQYLTTVLLDDFDRGAANPAGMAVSESGRQLIIALSGIHKICVIDLAEMHKKLEDVWQSDDGMDPRQSLDDIVNDLRFLHGMKKQIPVHGKSPRHVAVSGGKILVSTRFAVELEVYRDLGPKEEPILIKLGDEPEMDASRRGELNFGDAGLCFQHWQSCVTCHPDGRSDGLNWDLLNDGIGNPKNTKSMLFAHRTPPSMITGIREDAPTAVRAGVRHIQFAEIDEPDAQDIDVYLDGLKPIQSPHLAHGKLSKKASRGQVVFEKAGCSQCHSGPYYTDGQKYDVGTGNDRHRGDLFDTPTLCEVWRTSPYLYDGRARTLKEVFTKFNSENKHGNTANLSQNEMDALVEYVLSL
jgi:hypothetical protein